MDGADSCRQNTLTEEQQFVLSIVEKAGNKGKGSGVRTELTNRYREDHHREPGQRRAHGEVAGLQVTGGAGEERVDQDVQECQRALLLMVTKEADNL